MSSSLERRTGIGAVAALAISLSFCADALAQRSAPVDIYAEGAPPRWPAVTAFPEYPEDARMARREGSATVCFRINAQGEIVRPRVRSSTDKAFEKSALGALRESSFVPLAAGEVESQTEVCRVYRFRLTPLASPLGAAAPAPALAAAAESTANLEVPELAAQDVPVDEAPTLAAQPTGPREEVLVTSEQPDDERVCKIRRRPGSKIAATVCSTRAERIALEQATRRALRDMDDEVRWRDQVERERELRNQSAGGGGGGGGGGGP